MKHFALAILTYIAAVTETTLQVNEVHLDWIALVAAIAMCLQRFETAVVWALVLGLTRDAIGTDWILGTHALSYVVATSAARSLVSRLHERPVHVVCVAELGFVGLAALIATIITIQVRGGTDGWYPALMSVGTTWLAAVAVTTCVRATVGIAKRLQKPATNGGAVGTPVGLSVN